VKSFELYEVARDNVYHVKHALYKSEKNPTHLAFPALHIHWYSGTVRNSSPFVILGL